MNQRGLSILEVLVIITIVGILAGFGVRAIRSTQVSGQQNAFVNAFDLNVKSAAGYAATRRTSVLLTRADNRINFTTAAGEDINGDGGITIPPTLTANIPDGVSLIFGPNGTITARTLPNPVTISAEDRVWDINISTIGDTQIKERAP